MRRPSRCVAISLDSALSLGRSSGPFPPDLAGPIVRILDRTAYLLPGHSGALFVSTPFLLQARLNGVEGLSAIFELGF